MERVELVVLVFSYYTISFTGQESVFVYKIYVDNKFRTSLNGRNRCNALIEGVKSSQPHRVCVTATTSIGESTFGAL